MTDAILGTVATLPGLDGEVQVEIKAGTQSADIVIVKERGITRLRGGGRGELKVGIQVVTPVRLNSKEHQLIQQFAESRRPVPPEFSHVPAGSVREAARPVPRRLIAGSSATVQMASLYLVPRDRSSGCGGRRRRPGHGRRGAACDLCGPDSRRRAHRGRRRCAVWWSRDRARRPTTGSSIVSTWSAVARGTPTPAALARAGPRQGRPRRARRAGGDRAGGERRHPVGRRAFGVTVGGRQGREGPRALGGDRAGGEQAGHPRVGSRGGGARDDEAARALARRSSSCWSRRHPRLSPPSTPGRHEPILAGRRARGRHLAARARALRRPARTVRLGPEVLRTSTAGPPRSLC